ncbi:MAG: GNAT family N-acetyltransferase [Pleurocapsa sp. SU_196_0]|nr:GNAT family N-acetyltransferase [Pleurocapsa sp. SU_196_0]
MRRNLEEGFAIIMEMDGRAVGSVRCYPVFEVSDHGERFGPVALEIARLCVLPEYRGRGLSTWLMNEAMLSATHQGIEELRLAVRTDEPGLKSFYERQGFFEDSSIVYSHANPNSPKPITMRKYLFSRRPGNMGEFL